VYTGKTEQPRCPCDDSETAVRLDLPPWAFPGMKHAEAITWQDTVGEVSTVRTTGSSCSNSPSTWG
jgi:hypothetical protein